MRPCRASSGRGRRAAGNFDPAASYIEFRSQLTGTVVDLMVLVDLRTRAVVGISPGSRSQDASVIQLTDPSLLPPIDPTPEEHKRLSI